MKKLLLVIVASAFFVAPVWAQQFVVPEGAIGPGGGVNYVFPAGSPFQARMSHFPVAPFYWTSYPMVPVPGIYDQSYPNVAGQGVQPANKAPW
jgi:hypothetical protein